MGGPTRRELLGGVTVLGLAASASQLSHAAGAPAGSAAVAASALPASAAPATAPPALRGAHMPQPLPFNPAKLNGLSERLLVSHHDNNYVGAVNNLNRCERELAQVAKDTPAFAVGGLRQAELTYRNSMTLHEAYFGNLGGDGKPGGPIAAALAAAYGSFEHWELQFRSTAASLGGGSGWVVLSQELLTGELRTTAAINHTQALATSLPLLVMDMYEHAYALDFGAAAAKYIDAYFLNLQWDAVNRRLEQAARLTQSLRA